MTSNAESRDIETMKEKLGIYSSINNTEPLSSICLSNSSNNTSSKQIKTSMETFLYSATLKENLFQDQQSPGLLPREHIIKHKVEFEKMIILCSGTFGLAFWKPNCDMNGTIIQSINIEQRKSKGMLITNNILSKNSMLNYDIVALSYSYGMELSLQTFIEILKENSLDYYYCRSILDKHEKEANNYSYISYEYCHNQYHTKFYCTKLHYIPIKSEKVLRSRNYNSLPVQRKKKYFRRKHLYSKHAYIFRKRLFKFFKRVQICHLKDNAKQMNSQSIFLTTFTCTSREVIHKIQQQLQYAALILSSIISSQVEKSNVINFLLIM